jgi:cation diffusion facilitator CzcD-associated flavoprotein CzcO
MALDSSRCQFAVLGAGPYGMAVAAHLRAAGLETRIFGKPMGFWADHMPQGMLLRSPWGGSHIGDPEQALTLDRYEAALGRTLPRRVPLEDFVRYGHWYQQQALPDLDERMVAQVLRDSERFRINLRDGDIVNADNVVIAAGIGSFAHRPAPFADLAKELVSHSSDPSNRDLSRYAGKQVIVIGGGQSAIESAALLHESGAHVDVLVREPQMRWLKTRSVVEWLRSKFDPFKAPGRIGPIGLDWLIEHPRLFTLLPRRTQNRLAYRAIRPAASGWLQPRTEHVKFSTGKHAVAAEERGGQIHLKLSDGSKRTADHVLLGTGYKISLDRYDFLPAEIVQAVRTVNGYPVLNARFESTMPGLYFVGAPAAYSFGPLCRFVAGTQYTARTLARPANAGPARAKFAFAKPASARPAQPGAAAIAP